MRLLFGRTQIYHNKKFFPLSHRTCLEETVDVHGWNNISNDQSDVRWIMGMKRASWKCHHRLFTFMQTTSTRIILPIFLQSLLSPVCSLYHYSSFVRVIIMIESQSKPSVMSSAQWKAIKNNTESVLRLSSNLFSCRHEMKCIMWQYRSFGVTNEFLHGIVTVSQWMDSVSSLFHFYFIGKTRLLC